MELTNMMCGTHKLKKSWRCPECQELHCEECKSDHTKSGYCVKKLEALIKEHKRALASEEALFKAAVSKFRTELEARRKSLLATSPEVQGSIAAELSCCSVTLATLFEKNGEILGEPLESVLKELLAMETTTEFENQQLELDSLLAHGQYEEVAKKVQRDKSEATSGQGRAALALYRKAAKLIEQVEGNHASANTMLRWLKHWNEDISKPLPPIIDLKVTLLQDLACGIYEQTQKYRREVDIVMALHKEHDLLCKEIERCKIKFQEQIQLIEKTQMESLRLQTEYEKRKVSVEELQQLEQGKKAEIENLDAAIQRKQALISTAVELKQMQQTSAAPTTFSVFAIIFFLQLTAWLRLQNGGRRS